MVGVISMFLYPRELDSCVVTADVIILEWTDAKPETMWHNFLFFRCLHVWWWAITTPCLLLLPLLLWPLGQIGSMCKTVIISVILGIWINPESTSYFNSCIERYICNQHLMLFTHHCPTFLPYPHPVSQKLFCEIHPAYPLGGICLSL